MRTWIKTNLSKMTLALALTGSTTGTIGLIMGVLTHNVGGVKYFLKSNGERVYGDTTNWWNKFLSPNKTSLYFNTVKEHSEDIKCDVKYTLNYFNK